MSIDTVFARESTIFVLGKISDLNKQQADILGVNWVELRAKNGFMKFPEVLEELNIPYQIFTDNLEDKLNSILDKLVKGK